MAKRVLALVVRGGEVEVAFDLDLPLHFHRLTVDGRVRARVLRRIEHVPTVVGVRDAELGVAQDQASLVPLREDAVGALGVGDVDDLVDFHGRDADPGQAAGHLVVHVDVAAVVGAVVVAQVNVVGVTGHAAAEQVLAEVRGAPAGGALAVEDGDSLQLAHGRHAVDADFARLTAGPEAVVVVQLAGRHVGVLALGLSRGRGGGRGARRAVGGAPGQAQGDGRSAEERAGSDEESTAAARRLRPRVQVARSLGLGVVAHDSSPPDLGVVSPRLPVLATRM